VRIEELDYFCVCATQKRNIDKEGAGKCVFAADKKAVKTHFF
jgi:hypothetical protein